MRLYADLAPWWPLLSAPEDYAEEAALFLRTLRAHAQRPLHSLLELGSGGGNTASHLPAELELWLSDRSPQMLEVSRALLPARRHVLGDMRDLRLGRRFDAVLIHDAVSYLTSEGDLRAALETAAAHLEPGGVALFVPDATRESYRPGTSQGGHDRGPRGLRYLEWSLPPEPDGRRYRVEYAFLLREGDQVRSFADSHELGLHARGEWVDWIRDAGLEAHELPFEHSEFEPGEKRSMFLGVR